MSIANERLPHGQELRQVEAGACPHDLCLVFSFAAVGVLFVCIGSKKQYIFCRFGIQFLTLVTALNASVIQCLQLHFNQSLHFRLLRLPVLAAA